VLSAECVCVKQVAFVGAVDRYLGESDEIVATLAVTPPRKRAVPGHPTLVLTLVAPVPATFIALCGVRRVVLVSRDINDRHRSPPLFLHPMIPQS
jgi:hypothetical protein